MFAQPASVALLFSCILRDVYALPPELPPIPRDLSTPVAQRVAFNGPTGMTVAWNTFKPLTKPTVHYGISPHSLVHKTSSSSSVTYNTSRTWANTVKLTHLLPSTTLQNRLDKLDGTVETFETARLAGDHTPFTTAVVIDMGVFGPDGLSERNVSYTGQNITYPLKPKEHTTIQRLVQSASSYEFVLHPGEFLDEDARRLVLGNSINICIPHIYFEGDLAYADDVFHPRWASLVGSLNYNVHADTWLKELKLGYINGSKSDGPAIYEGLLEQFYDELSVVTKTKAYMVGPGTHEANCINGGSGADIEATLCPQGQTNFTQFINRFGLVMPTSSSSSSQFPLSGRTAQQLAREKAGRLSRPPFWYSFDYGISHFLIIDTETDLGVGIVGPDEIGGGQNDEDGPFGSYKDQQTDFIINDLASVDRLVTPWVIVAGHRPWYVSNGFPCPACQQAFEHLFIKYGVDLALFGHTHNAQLIKPVAYNITDPAGFNNPTAPMYIVQGAAGHFEGLEPLLPIPPSYLAWGNDTLYGFSKLVFKDRHHLEVQFIESDTGDILRSQTLYKNRTVRFVGA